MGHYLEVRVIGNDTDLYALRGQWNEVLVNSASNNIFLTWEWIYTWWNIFKEKRKLHIITFWRENELIGIAPFLARKIKYFGLIEYHRIELLASGEAEADEICSEYLNFIIRKGWEEEVIDGIIEHLINNAKWDEVILKELVAENINTRILLARIKAAGLKHSIERDDVAPYIELPASWEVLLAGMSSDFRYKIRRDRKKIGERGAVEITTVNTVDELTSAFDTLVKLHQSRWKKTGQKGCFSSKKFNDFHSKILSELFKRDQLRLLFLQINKKPVAVLYEFAYNNKILYYQSGFDVDYDPKLSVGNILRAYSIEKAIEEGFIEYDFLKGADKRHCQEWSSNEREIIKIRICKKGFKEFINSSFKEIKKKIRIIRPSYIKPHKIVSCEKSTR
jgi:CelD/BcsL family acetyltransferase involved in cellulose biosynthesis